MEFKQNNEELNYIEQQFIDEPCINVISKERFEERVYKVFTILWEKLAKSFGPGGAGTFISVYPAYYNTKDGFTIMKNIAFDKKLDQVISDMVMNVCSRLNFTVGDGTTTAVIATKSTYESYLQNRKFFDDNRILSRDILSRFENYKTEILNKLDGMSSNIRSEDPKELRENIEKVVYVSSNGNKEITNMIGEMYEKLMYPAITCVASNDGVMKSSIVEGYTIDVSLTDKLYINNDNQTLQITSGADVIMFSHKVMRDTYEKILKPLSESCKGRGRHLICIAPYYDETALNGIIRQDLNAEYRKEKDINLVLAVCSKVSGNARVSLEDLAMLLNTMIISPSTEREFMEELNNGESVYKFFDMDNRKIPNITICTETSNHTLQPVMYSEDVEPFHYVDSEKGIRLGFARNVEIGLKESTFSDFYYDESLYNTTVAVAKKELEEVQKKCEKVGTFNLELIHKQKRVYALGLKTGLIEVGADSDLTQGYLKDTVDDAVKAAASAYNNGVVLGCNITLMQAIVELMGEKHKDGTLDDMDQKLLEILLAGFGSVYMTVMVNMFSNREIVIEAKDDNGEYITKEEYLANIVKSVKKLSNFPNLNIAIDDLIKTSEIFTNPCYSIYDCILCYSIVTGQVLDMTKGEFNTEIINSAETDKEILTATLDLLSLLITGNQLVLR